MQTYICILRGINVSGHKLIKMDALKALYLEMDCVNVHTYIQSGNMVFQHETMEDNALAEKISKGIDAKFGFEVPALVKQLPELLKVLNQNPFLTERNEDPAKLHFTFFDQEPDEANIVKVKSGVYGTDEYFFSGNCVYLFCPNGYGNTKLSNTFFENKLKLTATTRNWKTINELRKIAENMKGLMSVSC